MPIEILMPALSPTMTEGNLARWLKQEGDEVSPGDVIAEIETDKATMEVEAVEAGRLGRILIGDGTEGVAVNTPIALLLEEGEDASALASAAAGGAKPAAPTPAAPAARRRRRPPLPPPRRRRGRRGGREAGNGADRGGRIFASPLARRMAEQAGIDLGRAAGQRPARPDHQDRHRARAPAGHGGQARGRAGRAGAAPAAARAEAPAPAAPIPSPRRSRRPPPTPSSRSPTCAR